MPLSDKKTMLSFPRKEKLKSKKQIDALFTKGLSLTTYPLKLLYLEASFSDGAKTKTMFVVPKRSIRGAVQRNRIKRLLREAYRVNRQHTFNNIEGNFALAILYLGKEMPNYVLVEKKMVGLLEKFHKKQSNGLVD